METKKRKKPAITQGTGGDHAASTIASHTEIKVTNETPIMSENWTSSKCLRDFSSAEEYWHHSCIQ